MERPPDISFKTPEADSTPVEIWVIHRDPMSGQGSRTKTTTNKRMRKSERAKSTDMATHLSCSSKTRLSRTSRGLSDPRRCGPLRHLLCRAMGLCRPPPTWGRRNVPRLIDRKSVWLFFGLVLSLLFFFLFLF